MLLQQGANCETPSNEGWTPIKSASSNGYIEIVRILLLKGAGCKMQNDTGSTALSEALNNGHTEIADLLLENGVSFVSGDSYSTEQC